MGGTVIHDLDNRSANLTEQLVDTIGKLIAGGRFRPGDTLPTEPELCLAHGASRNAVREAIKVLGGKGLVRTGRRLGTLVQPRGRWAMLDPQVLSWMLGERELRQALLFDLGQLRRIIEPEAAALAARSATAEERAGLCEAFAAMVRHRHDHDAAIAADIYFHERLFEASHNPLLASMSRSIDVLLRANFELAMLTENGFIRNLGQHGEVAEAIAKGDEDGARAAMTILLANNDRDLRAILSSRTTLN